MSTLVNLFDKYKCDKGSLKHRYDRVYEQTLNKIRNNNFRMLEIGVFNGNSTKAFVEFCPNAKFVGVDIFTRIAMKDVTILTNSRVTGCNCDSIIGPNNFFNYIAEDGFDIIIDDGLHTHEAQRKTFLNFIPFLKTGGNYFIEDVWAYDKMTDKQKKHPWLNNYGNSFSENNYQKLLNAIKIYDVIYHDLRKGYEPDTFIIEIIK